ncbi:MAG: 50S ribosomal protein L19 [Phycisphaerae bacterium]|nr:50S ribosomal protein L19 [Phycisphaerae bacterium]
MLHPLIKAVEDKARQPKPPSFDIGDRVKVHVRIVEGDKHRIQPYEGDVIARRGKGMGESFTVRRIVNNEGVERIFPLHSPKIAKVELVRSGHVRRAKLYYLRDRVGKARRVKDRKRTAAGKSEGTTEAVGTQS